MNAREVVLAYYAWEEREAERVARVAAIEAGGETVIGLANEEVSRLEFYMMYAVPPGTQAPLMRCGCVATAHDAEGRWVCPVHYGLHPGAVVEAVKTPDLSGRRAACEYCGKQQPSALTLPFFEYHLDQPLDSYYCGCRGWD